MDFDATFKIVTTHAETLATKLGAIAANGDPSLQLETKRDLKRTLGGGQWKVAAGAQGRVAVRVFASKADIDPDAIFGAAKKDSTKPSAILTPTDGQAWIKYELTGDATGKIGSSNGPATLAVSGKGRIALGAYLPASASATLAQALRQAGGIPFVLDSGDVRQLAPGQAAYVAVGGTLSAKLEFNWADVLTGPITPLQGLVTGDKPLNLAVDLKAGLAVAITISDSFRLVFSGVDADYIAISLNRASSGAFSVKGGASATARLEKPDMARDLLANLAAQLLGVQPERIAAVREQLETVLGFYDSTVAKVRAEIDGVADQLDAAIDAQGLPLLLTRLQQLQTVTRLARSVDPTVSQLGLTLDQMAKAASIVDNLAENLADQVGGNLDELLAASRLPALAKDATKALRGLLERIERIEAALLKMARTRIERGVSFEYRRIASDASVLKAKLLRGHADFDRWHRSLLGLDANEVLVAAEPANRNVVLGLFLNQASVKRTISLGLNLGRFYSDKDSAETQWTESTRMVAGAKASAPMQVERRMALQGSRSREETVLGTSAKCSGEFDADFVAAGPAGNAGRWSFALSLAYASATRKADQRWLLAVADYACVWGVIDESQIDWLVTTLEKDGAIGKKVEMEVGLTIDQAAFANPALFAALGTLSDADLGRALAVALQRMEQYPERATPASRAKAYVDAVSVLLGKKGIDVTRTDSVAKYVARHLTDASHDLQSFEGTSTRPIPAGSVAYLTQHTGSALGVIRELKQAKALSALAGVPALGSAAERKLVNAAFKGLDLAWRDRFLLRWQVSLLRELAARTGASGAMSSTLKVTVGNTGKARIISGGVQALAEP